MPFIRFRNPNEDDLGFVDVDENDFIAVEGWRARGWIEELRDEPPAEQLQAVREQAEVQAEQIRNMWEEFRAVVPPEEPVQPEALDWPPRGVWEGRFIEGQRFFWGGEEFEVFRRLRGDLDIQRFILPGRVMVHHLPEFRVFAAGAGVRHFTAPSGKKGEELFRLILSGIKEIYGVDAVVAGGAVRDLVVGDVEGTKDVDVFIPMKWEDFDKSSDELGWQGKPGLLRKKPYKTDTCKTSSARASAVVQGMPVDLVFMDGGLTPEGVDGFPVNAQKCVWNLQEGLVISPAAKADIDGKKFTISPKLTDKEAIKNVRDKVSGWLKRPIYKGWKVIEPETKEWWQKQNDPHTVERAKKKKSLFDIETAEVDAFAAHVDRWWNN